MIDFFRIVPKRRKVPIRRKSGIIISNPSGLKRYIFYVGNLLFLTGLAGIGYWYWPLFDSVVRYESKKYNLVSVPTPTSLPEQITPTPTPVIEDLTYEIEIPKILAKAAVVEGVSPFDQAEYTRVLKNEVVAQAKDTAIPGSGKGKLTYIFAHSSQMELGMIRKNSVFYLLGELGNGDEVFINYHGQNITYRVFDKKIIDADEIEYLKYSDPEREVLILQTCWPIGTNWKRLLVLAEPAGL